MRIRQPRGCIGYAQVGRGARRADGVGHGTHDASVVVTYPEGETGICMCDRKLRWTMVPLWLGLLAPACGMNQTTSSTALDTGYLTLEWTVDGQKDGALCTSVGAAGVELNVFDARNYYLGAVSTPCHRFFASVELEEGSYKLLTRLIDNDHVTVGEMQRLETISVTPNAEVTAAVDFPGADASGPTASP